MAKKDFGSGFLARIVNFVRDPATGWSGLDAGSIDDESQYGRTTLKEVIKRKRRNDFVRKREFDMLRDILNRGGIAKVTHGGEGVRPSFFQSSLSSKPDDRAMTLKKINEIEAQMSMQWWKTKGPDSVPSTGSSLHPSTPLPLSNAKFEHKQTTPAATDVESQAAHLQRQYTKTKSSALSIDSVTVADDDRDLMPTLREALSLSSASPPLRTANGQHNTPLPPPVTRAGLMVPQMGAVENSPAVFSASHFYTLNVQAITQTAEVEDAAIRFANGDDAGAEQCLLDALGAEGAGWERMDNWLALFDLYRATGQLIPFEGRALEFASRFGRSAPQWYDMASAVLALGGSVRRVFPESSRAAWISEPDLDAYAVGSLQNRLQRAHQPWVLDWSAIETIDVKAARALLGIFTIWGDQDIELRFLNAPILRDLLRRLTPINRRDIEQLWWELRMAALRVMNRPEEFEQTALDFCVTYEVSPPAWEQPRCHFKELGADGVASMDDGSVLGDAVIEQMPSIPFGDTGIDIQPSELNHLGLVELSGEIRGDPQETLEALEQRLQSADVWIISCRNLIRADFSAVGTLLNWVNAQNGRGRMIQFVDVHRLMSAFFHVVGITECAKVVLRND